MDTLRACDCGHRRYAWEFFDRTLYRKVNYREHFFHNGAAWSYACPLLDRHRQDFDRILIDDEYGRYEISADDFWRRKFNLNLKGVGPQYYIKAKHFRFTPHPGASQPEWLIEEEARQARSVKKAKPEPPASAQMPMF